MLQPFETSCFFTTKIKKRTPLTSCNVRSVSASGSPFCTGSLAAGGRCARQDAGVLGNPTSVAGVSAPRFLCFRKNAKAAGFRLDAFFSCFFSFSFSPGVVPVPWGGCLLPLGFRICLSFRLYFLLCCFSSVLWGWCLFLCFVFCVFFLCLGVDVYFHLLNYSLLVLNDYWKSIYLLQGTGASFSGDPKW